LKNECISLKLYTGRLLHTVPGLGGDDHDGNKKWIENYHLQILNDQETYAMFIQNREYLPRHKTRTLNSIDFPIT